MENNTVQKFEIKCRELTPERRKILAPFVEAVIGRPLRLVIAVGGAWLFYYGTSFNVPAGVQAVAIIFAVAGIAAILFAIFSQKLAEMRFFANAQKNGCFPEEVSVGKGGMFVRRRSVSGTKSATSPKDARGNAGVTSVNAERFFSFSEIGKIREYDDYFKIGLPYGDADCVYIFKEDFEQGEPEAFIQFIVSKKSAV